MRKNPVVFDDQTKKRMIEDIQVFFREERGDDMGDLAAMLVLDFFIENLASEAYNQGLRDALKYMSERIDDAYSLEK
tara:strand:+ start:313 stop:543 length:231 start_codon:yes stop_codon:yes gene_type:complete